MVWSGKVSKLFGQFDCGCKLAICIRVKRNTQALLGIAEPLHGRARTLS